MPKYKKESRDSRLKHIVVPAMPKARAQALPVLKKILARLKTALKLFKQPKEPTLIGRIHELDSHAEEYQVLLTSIKGNFSSEEDPETYIFVEAIIDPLLKEIDRIQKNLHSGSVMQQAKTFKAYGEWIDRARLWAHFYDTVHSKQQLIEAVIHQLVGETLKRIDRDLLVIEDYQQHQMQGLLLSQERSRELAAELTEYLKPHQDQLNNLKKRPSHLTLEEVSKWKGQIDSHRQTFFESALHVIDAFMERESPSLTTYEATEHLHEVISEIAYLERECQDLVEEINTLHADDWKKKEMLLCHLNALEEQTHLLHLDMKLGWELVGRLQKINAILEHGRRQLDN